MVVYLLVHNNEVFSDMIIVQMCEQTRAFKRSVDNKHQKNVSKGLDFKKKKKNLFYVIDQKIKFLVI